MSSERILLTGCAGFIGFHLAKSFLKRGYFVYGIDDLNPYYTPALKEARLKNINHSNFRFQKLSLNDLKLSSLVREIQPTQIVHMAAQAGVRYSIEQPQLYINSNVLGTLNLLEAVKDLRDCPILYASSSSVYGIRANRKPFLETDITDTPASIYAATKKSVEVLVHSYCSQYGLTATGLRFFTVYGPWGRPDMAYYSFSSKISRGQSIEIYNNGNMMRDFTFVDDIVESINRLMNIRVERKDVKHDIYNIGAQQPVELGIFVETLMSLLGKKTEIIYKPMAMGDVEHTYADVTKLQKLIDYTPKTTLRDGLRAFVDWYLALPETASYR